MSKAGNFLDWRAHRLPYPSNLLIDIHSYCNAKCRVCPYPQLKDHLPMGFMPRELFTRLIDEFAEIKRRHGVRGNVIFCAMGELFLDPEAVDKVKYVQERGLNMVVQTNAALFTKDKVDALLEGGNPPQVFVSFHGVTPGVYRDIMGLPYEKALENTKYAISRLPDVRIRACCHDFPLGEARRVKRFWREIKPDIPLRLFLPNARTGLLPHLHRTSLKYPGPWLKGCRKGLPLRDMVVTFEGKAVLCCEDMGQRAVLGNVGDTSLAEVWNSDAAHATMDYLFGGGWGDREDRFLCRSCEFGQSTNFRRLVKNLDHQWQMASKTRF